MRENKGQHVVPRFYLAFFEDSQGLVHAFDRSTGKTFATGPKSLGIEGDCYSVIDEGRRDMSADEVNKAVESNCSILLQTLELSVVPSNDQWRAIWMLTANFLTRSRRSRDRLADPLEFLLKKLDWQFINELGNQPSDIEGVPRRAAKVHHAAVVGGGLQPFAEELRLKPCELLVAPPSNRFITSDDPSALRRDISPINQ
jgi:hypothetical protein